MTQEQQGPVHAPELNGGEWLQGGPVPIKGRGKVVLIDFWDYTCVNCLRTLPYLKEWHRRYEALGLTVVGVHTPEFSFARNADHVRNAIRHLELPYPVIHDGNGAIWSAYANRYWPAKYFIDARGYIRATHFGEGGYLESELAIQTLLAEQEGFDPSTPFPEPMAPVRTEDAVGAVCYRVTPELYCGYQRGLIGNVGEIAPDRPQTYVDPGRHVEGMVYLDGDWLLGGENLARPFGGARGRPSRLHLAYMAADVNLVLHPPLAGGGATMRVLLDGAPIDAAHAGDDVRDGVVTVDVPRMYSLVKDNDVQRHDLVLETESDGLAAFAFTFTSCVIPPPES